MFCRGVKHQVSVRFQTPPKLPSQTSSPQRQCCMIWTLLKKLCVCVALPVLFLLGLQVDTWPDLDEEGAVTELRAFCLLLALSSFVLHYALKKESKSASL